MHRLSSSQGETRMLKKTIRLDTFLSELKKFISSGNLLNPPVMAKKRDIQKKAFKKGLTNRRTHFLHDPNATKIRLHSRDNAIFWKFLWIFEIAKARWYTVIENSLFNEILTENSKMQLFSAVSSYLSGILAWPLFPVLFSSYICN